MNTCVAYLRVSTLGQVKDGVSLEAQRDKINLWAQMNDATVIQTFSDNGISAKRSDNRPAFQQALALAIKERCPLVVYSISRFARSTRDCLALAEKLQKAGAGLVSITESIDTSSAMGKFFFRLMASLAELEREMISERTQMGMDKLRQQGRYMSRIVPYGYQKVGDYLITDEKEQNTISVMRSGAQMLGYSGIANLLNRTGEKSRSGKPWTADGVRAVLRRAKRNGMTAAA